MVIAAAATAAVAAAGLGIRRRVTPGARLSSLGAVPGAGTSGERRRRRRFGDGVLSSRRSRLIASVAAVIAGVEVLGPAPGALAGAGLAALAMLTAGGVPAARIDGGELALVADLVAGCLAGGTLLPDAVLAAADATDGALRDLCWAAAQALRTGASPEAAWATWLADPRLAAVARTAVRTAYSGAATADELTRTAARIRSQRRAVMQQRVRQASVWVVVPLGLCFLPAFVLVAVVPMVVGLLPTLT